MPGILVILVLFFWPIRPVFADVASEVGEYNDKGLPPADVLITISGIVISETPAPEDSNAAHEYDSAYDKGIEEVNPRSFMVWLQKIWERFQDLFGDGVTEEGNRNAQDYYNANLPEDAILPGEPMDFAYSCSKCQNLPPGECICGVELEPSGIPTPTGDVSAYPTSYPLPTGADYYSDTAKCRPFDYIKSPVTLPAICYEQPGNFETDSTISNGTCKIPDRGFCSPGCLKSFFGNDEKMARKAAMVCYKESGGDANLVNSGCLQGISNEYSVGLFQINLKNEDKNPWTQGPRSYQCWNTVEPVGQISCSEGTEINSCTGKFSTPEINIPEAWNLWYDRYLYYTDLCTVFGSSLHWIWEGWTVAQPLYCGIKY